MVEFSKQSVGRLAVFFSLISALPFPLVVYGQTSGVGAGAGVYADSIDDTGAATIVYGQEFFAQYNLITAEDILRRIPGLSSILDDSGSSGGGANGQGEQRGFGSDGDQILINGRRLAGKSNEISSALRRIQVRNLDRVELLRGTSEEIDVRSDGIVVNLILKEGTADTSSGSVTLAARLNEFGFFEPDGSANFNSEIGNLKYLLGIERRSIALDNQRTGFVKRFRDEVYFYPTGELMQDRPIETNRTMEEIAFTLNSAYEFAGGDKLQLNALLRPTSFQTIDEAEFTEYAIDGTPGLSATDIRGLGAEQQIEFEIGGTYERRVGDSGSLKLLSVFNHNDQPTLSWRTQVTDGELAEISRNDTDILNTEAILRGSYYFPLLSDQTLEVGAEVARNTLEQTIQLAFDLDGDGIAEDIEIFDPSSEVEEIRSEIFANHNWTLDDRWSIASSLIAEASTITQSGVNISSDTSFQFLKPRVDIRFTPVTTDLLRFKIERTVSQLNFSNFVPRYNVRDDRFTAGNPDLRPETAWQYEFGYEHRLGNDQGVLRARIFYNDIQDRIESVALDLDGDGDFDTASGNIGDATEYGGEIGFSLRMTSIGLPNLLLDGSYLRRWSSVIDPFTGIERKMATNADYEATLSIRHDVSDWNFSYGGVYRHDGGKNLRSEWREFRYFERQPEINAFVEKRFGNSWILRFDAFGLTRNKRERNRTIFQGGDEYGVVTRREYYEETRDRRYTLALTATF
jgi:outer membrane receptor protein involved in Fe transport